MLQIFKKISEGFAGIYHRYNRQSGYTIAETLVYSAILGLILAIIIQSALGLSRTHGRSKSYLNINATAIGAFGKLSRDIRRATDIDVINSTLSASSGKLALQMKRSDGTNDSVIIYLEDEKVKLEENGIYIGDLTPEDMAVSNLTFRRFIATSTTATTTAVRVELTVAPANQPLVPALNFYGTYVLRGSYVE